MTLPKHSPHGFYRHYKTGHIYKLLNDDVTNEADGVRMVHYKREKNPQDPHRTWVRPHDDFYAEVEPGKRRFHPILSMAELMLKPEEQRKPELRHIIDKGGEYYQAARHAHTRGCADIIRETGTIVAALKEEGKTFDDLIEFMQKQDKDGKKPVVDQDLFLKHVQRLFEGRAH